MKYIKGGQKNKKMKKKFSFWFIFCEVFVLMWSLALLIFGYNRIRMALSILKDPYPLHFGNVGLMYFSIGVLLLILFFILIIFRKETKNES